ncbi:hypothetical protein [Mesorhizobium sp.]|uniref:hypothetical protein n=1 Tax=Mesorhizobium sp. TaxID=1871066 RepID=UPI000FE3A6C7|nr:hypothetical protein [Mesorhizobium sp.]RWI35515.1 MAG: hypothetical protein EOR14_28850 [Mesorhizobium sp.]RWJ03451.1 MAG: hypothetical protein EOR24_32230 [Mesorhizobium sp.]RWJ66316.1 MAG: hypothetical protein EOR34_28285 [Mesorhizobium sp.]
MAYFYTDTKAPGAPQINVWKMNGTNGFMRHYENYLFLQFVTKNPRASEAEKRQARHELTICEGKLAFWRRHPNYDHEEAMQRVNVLKKQWQQEGVAA